MPTHSTDKTLLCTPPVRRRYSIRRSQTRQNSAQQIVLPRTGGRPRNPRGRPLRATAAGRDEAKGSSACMPACTCTSVVYMYVRTLDGPAPFILGPLCDEGPCRRPPASGWGLQRAGCVASPSELALASWHWPVRASKLSRPRAGGRSFGCGRPAVRPTTRSLYARPTASAHAGALKQSIFLLESRAACRRQGSADAAAARSASLAEADESRCQRAPPPEWRAASLADRFAPLSPLLPCLVCSSCLSERGGYILSPFPCCASGCGSVMQDM